VTRVVFVTQQIDPAHPTLGAAVGMVRALAARVDEVTVLALRAVPGTLPGNCHVRTFAAGSKATRGARFATALAQELTPRPAALIAHMSPIYALLAAPVCRPLGVPVVLWFTHWRASPLLRAATRASTVVATAEPGSFPFASSKVVAIGHAIDLDELPCRPDPHNDRLQALALGRTSAIKRIETIVESVHRARAAGVDVELEVRGASETGAERAYRQQVLALAGDGVRVEQPVPRTGLPALFARTDVLVNATIEGSLDKAVLEACASCVPALASSPAFEGLLPAELRFAPGDAGQLAERIAALATRDAGARTELGHELRRRVAERHSAQSWAGRILGLVHVS
jgi:glycosyltransferase involved in cell wall biosynthesis